jgi:adenylate cyclase
VPVRTAEQEWRQFLLHADPIHHSLRAFFRLLPHDPRCTSCAAPFDGAGSRLARAMGFVRFDKNPRWCAKCFGVIQRKARGGAEVELSMLFADVRGSTPLAERLPPTAFHEVMDRFYETATKAAIDEGALIERFMGDQVVAYFVPGFAGAQHARRALEAGRQVLRETGHTQPDGPWVPVGVGVHTGIAFVGTVGDPGSLVNFTALGDNVNLAARLASEAQAGEMVASEATAVAAGLRDDEGERRTIAVKGKSGPVAVRVLSAA